MPQTGTQPIYRLSPLQRWILAGPGGEGEWGSRVTIDLAGRLSVPALTAAVEDLVARHEMLRTRFVRMAGLALPVQTVAPAGVVTLAQGSAAAAVAPWSGLAARLRRLAEERWALDLVLPALCGGRASLRRLAAELAALYPDCGSRAGLAEAGQYADVAEWWNELEAGPQGSQGRAHWAGLAGWEEAVPAVPGWRADGAWSPPVRLEQTLPAAVVAGLAAAGPLEGVLLALWQVLLGRLSGRTEVLSGVQVSGRPYPELAGVVGPFARQVAVTGAVAPLTPLPAVAEAAQAAWATARRWQNVLGERLPAAVARPAFCLALDLTERLAWQGGEVRLAITDEAAWPDRFALGLTVRRAGAGLTLVFEFPAAAWDAAAVARLAEQFVTLAAAAAARPRAAVGALPLLTAAARQRLVNGFNPPPPGPASDVVTRILAAAQARPDAIAVASAAGQLSYGALIARAGRLAGYLRQHHGVGPEQPVALLEERRGQAVIGLLGCLLAGAAYLPLDPGQPPKRLHTLLATAGARLALAPAARASTLPPDIDLICLDRDHAAIAAAPSLHHPTPPDAIAYLIYTSGSTGTPKPVAISRNNLAHSTAARDAVYDACVQAFLLVSPLAVDSAVAGIFWTLCQGGTLHISPELTQGDVPGLIDLIVRHAPSHLLCLPSVYQALLADPGLTSDLAWPTVIVAGEVCPSGLPIESRRIFPQTRLYNEYGPTEGTVWCSVEPIEPDPAGSSVPIGKPIPTTRLYIADANLEPVPLGLPGQLMIGGPGVARGYLGRPAATAEAFLPDPFGGEPGGRLYATGDRARYRADGRIEFIGREDDQIKIQGYRVEIGEIEAALASHPAVTSAAVVARSEEGKAPGLTAYVVPHRHRAPAVAVFLTSLRAHLTERLPGPMIPATIMFVDRLPRSPAGKLDRRSLPPPETLEQAWTGRVSAPATETERSLAAIWTAVLAMDAIGRESNFFECGGHSLLAARMMIRVRGSLGVNLPVRALLQAPTLAAFAAAVDQAATSGRNPTVAPIQRSTPQSLHPLSSAQRRLWFLHQAAPQSPALNLAAAIRIQGPLDRSALAKAVAAIVNRHEVLRTTFAAVDGRPMARVAAPANGVLRLVDLRGVPRRQTRARELTIQAARLPFNLAVEPPLRASLVVLDKDDAVLLLTLHHIAADGESIALLFRELAALYAAKGGGALPEPQLQYRDYAAWESSRLTDTAMEHHLVYWRRQLADAPILQLPLDRPRRPVSPSLGGRVSLHLDTGTSTALRALCTENAVSLFVALLTLFKIQLAYLCRSDDIVVGSPHANRDRIELESLLGLVANTVVYRTDLSGAPSVRTALRRVAALVADADAHKDVPFEMLVQKLSPRRVAGCNPFFQIWFLVDPAGDSRFSLPGLRLSHWEGLRLDDPHVRHDLRLGLSESADGIAGTFDYRAALFDRITVERLARQFEKAVALAVSDPDLTVPQLHASLSGDGSRPPETAEPDPVRAASPTASVGSVANGNHGSLAAPPWRSKRRRLELLEAELVRFDPPTPSCPLWSAQPAVTDFDPLAWAEANTDAIAARLERDGALLLRQFPISDSSAFGRLLRALFGPLLAYSYASTPRTALGDGLYSSTEYPADQVIPLHNEMSYAAAWPCRIGFFCRRPAAAGGETPIADSAIVFARIDAEVRHRFEAHGVQYLRNYGQGLDLPWQRVFGVDSRREVEQRCAAMGIEVEWRADNRLTTRERRPATLVHPPSGRTVWFNQAHLFHESSLPAAVRAAFRRSAAEDLPRSALFGDGSPIRPADLAVVRAAYRAEMRVFAWQPHDILLLENLLTAHGRMAFCGERSVVVGMA